MGTYRKVNHAKVIILIGWKPQLRQEKATQTRATAASDGLPAVGCKRAGKPDKQTGSKLAHNGPAGREPPGRKSVSMPLLWWPANDTQHGLAVCGGNDGKARIGPGTTRSESEPADETNELFGAGGRMS